MAVVTIDGELLTTAVHREFGGQERRFELRLGEIRKLEQRTGVGIGEVYKRMALLSFTSTELRETIKLGLVGGSEGKLSEPDAEALARAFVDGWPLNETHALANVILQACFVGLDGAGKPRGSTPRPSGDPETSAPSTSPAPPADGTLGTSIA